MPRRSPALVPGALGHQPSKLIGTDGLAPGYPFFRLLYLLKRSWGGKYVECLFHSLEIGHRNDHSLRTTVTSDHETLMCITYLVKHSR